MTECRCPLHTETESEFCEVHALNGCRQCAWVQFEKQHEMVRTATSYVWVRRESAA